MIEVFLALVGMASIVFALAQVIAYGWLAVQFFNLGVKKWLTKFMR